MMWIEFSVFGAVAKLRRNAVIRNWGSLECRRYGRY